MLITQEIAFSFALGAGAGAIAAYFKSYLGKKGENRATSEDIAELTRKVAEVNSSFSRKLEALAQSNREVIQDRGHHNELRLAAIDKRLEVHQEAFKRSFELYFSAHEDDARVKAGIHMQWWREHCLYLSERSSTAFVKACAASSVHRLLLDASGVTPEKLEENWARLDGLWDIIAADVKLPALGPEALQVAKAELAEMTSDDAR